MVDLTAVEPSDGEGLKTPIKNPRISWDDIDRKLIERPSFFFLYGTNLTDAAESASNAKILLSQNLKSYQKISQQQAEEIVKNLDNYQKLLNDLSLFNRKSPSDGPAKKHEIEIDLRKKGPQW
jgi:hypothetical protein